MKYGLITYKNTENIGDDIQSYVAMRFLPHIDYYIEREAMDLFVPKEKEQVVTILNGWFLHSKINFPLSPYIKPYFISTHFSGYNSGGIRTEYLNKYAKKYLAKYEPIGCRDNSTIELLNKVGIKNYFSGCLTLTIERDPKIKKQKYICLVDIDEEAEKLVLSNTKKDIRKITHTLDVKENSKLDWDTRFKNVKKVLDQYQAASLVITSRLHCALPCLALGTPVLLLYDEEKEYTKDRLKDYAEILNHMSTKEFLEKGVEFLKQKKHTNPSDYLKIRNSVEKSVIDFIKNVKVNNNNLPEIKDYSELYVKPKKNIDKLYHIAVDDMYITKRNYVNLNYEKEYWKKEFYILLDKYEEMKKIKEELEFKFNNIENNK